MAMINHWVANRLKKVTVGDPIENHSVFFVGTKITGKKLDDFSHGDYPSCVFSLGSNFQPSWEVMWGFVAVISFSPHPSVGWFPISTMLSGQECLTYTYHMMTWRWDNSETLVVWGMSRKASKASDRCESPGWWGVLFTLRKWDPHFNWHQACACLAVMTSSFCLKLSVKKFILSTPIVHLTRSSPIVQSLCHPPTSNTRACQIQYRLDALGRHSYYILKEKSWDFVSYALYKVRIFFSFLSI